MRRPEVSRASAIDDMCRRAVNEGDGVLMLKDSMMESDVTMSRKQMENWRNDTFPVVSSRVESTVGESRQTYASAASPTMSALNWVRSVKSVVGLGMN